MIRSKSVTFSLINWELLHHREKHCILITFQMTRSCYSSSVVGAHFVNGVRFSAGNLKFFSNVFYFDIVFSSETSAHPVVVLMSSSTETPTLISSELVISLLPQVFCLSQPQSLLDKSFKSPQPSMSLIPSEVVKDTWSSVSTVTRWTRTDTQELVSRTTHMLTEQQEPKLPWKHVTSIYDSSGEDTILRSGSYRAVIYKPDTTPIWDPNCAEISQSVTIKERQSFFVTESTHSLNKTDKDP